MAPPLGSARCKYRREKPWSVSRQVRKTAETRDEGRKEERGTSLSLWTRGGEERRGGGERRGTSLSLSWAAINKEGRNGCRQRQICVRDVVKEPVLKKDCLLYSL